MRRPIGQCRRFDFGQSLRRWPQQPGNGPRKFITCPPNKGNVPCNLQVECRVVRRRSFSRNLRVVIVNHSVLHTSTITYENYTLQPRQEQVRVESICREVVVTGQREVLCGFRDSIEKSEMSRLLGSAYIHEQDQTVTYEVANSFKLYSTSHATRRSRFLNVVFIGFG